MVVDELITCIEDTHARVYKLGEMIRQADLQSLRGEHSQAEIALLAAVQQSIVSCVERGKLKGVSVPIIKRVLAVYARLAQEAV